MNGLRNNPSPSSIRDKVELIANPHHTYSKWEIAFIIFTILVVLLMAIVAIFVIVYSTNNAGVRRYCPTMSIGSITLNINDRTIGWYIQYDGSIGTPNNLWINGPILPGMTTAPVYIALCGYPSSFACDLSIPGVLKGIITELNPGGVPLKPYIETINSEPSLYYPTINNQTLGSMGNLC